jgi:hypothetical protein
MCCRLSRQRHCDNTKDRDARERREDSERPDEATSRRVLMAAGPETPSPGLGGTPHQ